MNSSYENVIAECPHCGHLCVFNRVTDLRTTESISGLEVACFKCGKPFRIVGDRITTKHEALIDDCYELAARKEYMAGILTLAQSYEVFFSAYLRAELLLKPFALDPDIARLNAGSKELFDKCEEYTFKSLRSLFLRRVVGEARPRSWTEAEKAVANLPQRNPGPPSDSAINKFSDPKISALLMKVKQASVNKTRNKVVHRLAYRPTRDEFEGALADAKATLPSLTSLLDINDDANYYLLQLKS